jgi:hypothetical protein
MVTRRQALRLSVASGLAGVLSAGAWAEQSVVLIMIEEPGCPYCARWHREVGPAYPNSPEGRFAPLVRLMRGDSRIAAIRGLNYSPTFLVMRASEEIGRITGYPGADFFWPMLDGLLAKAGFHAEPGVPAR